MLALVLSLSCAEDPARPTAPEVVDASETRAWVYEPEAAEPEAEWTADEAAAAVNVVFAAPMVGCRDIMSAFQETRALGDDDPVEGCPRGNDLEGLNVIGGCTSESGYTFDGVADWDWDLTETDETVETVGLFVTDFEIEDPSGLQFIAGGQCNYTSTFDVGTNEQEVTTDLLGSWIMEWADTRLSLGVSAVIDATISGVGEASRLTLDGGQGVGFDHFMFDGFDWNGTCEDGPAGVLRYRGAENWYTFDFGDDCDDCADVTFHIDHALGEACPVLAPAMDDFLVGMAAPTDVEAPP